MPIVDIATPDILADRAQQPFFTPGKDDVDHGSDVPDWGAATSAAFRRQNFVRNLFGREEADPTPQEGYRAWDEIKGTVYEPNWSRFTEAVNPAQANAIKRRLDQERADEKLLAAAPWYMRLLTEGGASVLDLPTLVPGGAFVRGAKGGYSIGRSALSVGAAAGAGTAAQEAALHSLQETRSIGESVGSVGASVLVGGLLGAAGGKLLNGAEWNAAIKALDDGMIGDAERAFAAPADISSPPVGAAGVGAARVGETLEQNTVAGALASKVAASTKGLNPLLKVLNNPSPVAREIGLKLMENSVYLRKNMEGIASEPAAETLMKEWRAGMVRGAKEHAALARSAWQEANMGRVQFNEAVGRAMRRADQDENPIVAQAAQMWRKEVFDPLKDAAIAAKLLPEDVAVDTAASYFTRMWNRNKLIARESEFKKIVQDWVAESVPRIADDFDMETLKKGLKLEGDALREFQIERRVERSSRGFDEPGGYAKEIADDVFDTLTGRGGVNAQRPDFITIKARGPLKERTFNIPDHLVENFLEHDVEHVARRYSRVMSADVEIARKFGSVDMKDQIQAIKNDFERLREGVTDEKQLRKLADAEADMIGGDTWNGVRKEGQISAVRDILRGTRDQGLAEGNFSRIARAANQFNYLRSMGQVMVASLGDVWRPAQVHGLMRYMETLPKLITSLDAVKMSVKEAQLAGNVAEKALAHRMATLAEVSDPYARRSPVEAMLENMTNFASRWNGIRLWTDTMKSIASVMTQNRILNGVGHMDRMKKSERAYLAYLGIDENMAERIQKQFQSHGHVEDGVRVANTEAWDDAVARRTYRAAINRDVDSVIVEKSAGDVHLFAHTPTGRLLLQFKSFALASHQRVLMRGLQEGPARFLSGMIGMTALGMMSSYLYTWLGNRPEQREKMLSNPGWWIGEGLDRSGIFAVPMEIANALEKGAGVNLLKSPFRLMDDGDQESQRIQNRGAVGALLGPTFGLAEDAMAVAGIGKTLYQGNELSKSQKASAARMIPFSSYYGARQILRYGLEW